MIFQPWGVDAIRRRIKTQTRRVIVPQPIWRAAGDGLPACWEWAHPNAGKPTSKYYGYYFQCNEWDNLAPFKAIMLDCAGYGTSGDLIWVKETHFLYGRWRQVKGQKTKTGKPKWKFYRLDQEVKFLDRPPHQVAEDRERREGWHKRPAIFLEREDCRLWLEITGLDAEQVMGISFEDAVAEGLQTFRPYEHSKVDHFWVDGFGSHVSPVALYREIWNAINTGRGFGWGLNPWAAKISFKVRREQG